MDDEELLGIKKKKLGTNVLQELRKLAEIAETMKKQPPHTKTAEAEKNATLARAAEKYIEKWQTLEGDTVQMSPVKYITIPGHGPCEFTPESMQRMIKNEEVRHKATTELLDRTCADFNAKKEELRKAKIEIDNLQKQMQSLITTLNSVGMNQQQH